MIAWFVFTMPNEETRLQQKKELATRDSLARIEAFKRDSLERLEGKRTPQISDYDAQQAERKPIQTGLFATSSVTEEAKFTVETPLYTVKFTNKGAGPIKFTLKEYNNWDGTPVQMIEDTAQAVYNFGFLTTENYNVDTQNLLFKQVTRGTKLTVNEDDSKELQYVLELADGNQILYTYLFYGDNYEIDLDVKFIGLSDYIIGGAVDFSWTSGLNFTEKDKSQDALETAAFVYLADELEEFNLTKPGTDEVTYNGNIQWAATRTKFFTQLIKPLHNTEAAILTGQVTGESGSPTAQHIYKTTITSDISSSNALSYKLFVGPMRYYEIKKVDEHAYDMVKVGYNWIRFFSDPFVRFIIIPFFTYLSLYIENYGILIIIFAATVKLILTPLTLKSYRSMAAMREVQPLLKEIQDKYKDNPQKLQQETMKLYKKEKVNPLGGCLPNLLQFPILITLWRFFQNSIILRQESFLWAEDLSAPDYIINLPFSIPFLGESIAGFVLLMSAAMVVQSRLTGGMSTPGGGGGAMAQQMKIMQYIFPFMMLFIFNKFAAGLSLYYLVFNVLSILQQYFINKKIHAKHEAAVVK